MSRARAAALRFAAPALAALALAAGPLCAQPTAVAADAVPAPAVPAAAVPAAVVRHAAQVTRGGLLAVLVATLEPVGAVRVQLQDEAGRTLLEVPAVPLGRGGPLRLRLALLGVPSTREAGAYRVQVEGYAALDPPAAGLPAGTPPGGAPASAAPPAGVGRVALPAAQRRFRLLSPLQVLPREFLSERLPLDQGLTDLRARPDPRKEQEARRLWSILNTVNPGALHHTGPFRPPLPAGTRRTATFADRRVYEYASGGTADSVHNGVDLASPTGTPVAAPAAGVVVLAAPRLVTGLTVILEHLPGLYTLYYHLSALEVEAGERVSAGQVIGRVGSTGLATGPHLHWEARAGSVAVDPDGLTLERIVDKSAVFGIIGRILAPERR